MTSPLTPPTTGPALPSARRVSIGVEAMTRNASLTIGAATAPSTVQTGQMSRLRARRESAGTVSSSVRTIIAPLSLQSATGGTIVGIGVMRKTATMSVRSTSSSARSRVVASLELGSVMEMPTVWMARTKLRICATNAPVMTRLNSSVETESAFPSCGTVTTTTIVGMTQTSPLTSVATETAQLAGDDAQVQPTTDASLNGCSAMARMTVETEQTRWLRTAHDARTKETSLAEISAVCPNVGCVTLRMTAVTTLTREMSCVQDDTGSAQNLSSNAAMTNAFLEDGAVTTTMIVVMGRMRTNARSTHARRRGSSVPPATVSRRS